MREQPIFLADFTPARQWQLPGIWKLRFRPLDSAIAAAGAFWRDPAPRMKLCVLNPGGNDPEQHFPHGAGTPEDGPHAPVNYHGFAACTGGGFYRKDNAIPAEAKAVLVLLRHDLKSARQAVVELRREKKIVGIAWKEAGPFQIAAQLAKPAKLQLFREICERADLAIATTVDAVPLFRHNGIRHVEFVPTPYPIEETAWNFSVPIAERRGIFVGTREFDIPSRNHFAALLSVKYLAESMMEPVTVFNVAGWSGRRMLAQLRFPENLLRVIEGRRPYAGYLRGMAKHKFVYQLDASSVPGQVAGDALLCRIPCVGGDGTTERLVFPDTCGYGRSHEQLFDIAARLLEHDHDSEAITTKATELAQKTLSFSRVAQQLEQVFTRFSR
jgi:hypothetical protein